MTQNMRVICGTLLTKWPPRSSDCRYAAIGLSFGQAAVSAKIKLCPPEPGRGFCFAVDSTEILL
jgi:hypothetical protein